MNNTRLRKDVDAVYERYLEREMDAIQVECLGNDSAEEVQRLFQEAYNWYHRVLHAMGIYCYSIIDDEEILDFVVVMPGEHLDGLKDHYDGECAYYFRAAKEIK
jgi:hypothetical protein